MTTTIKKAKENNSTSDEDRSAIYLLDHNAKIAKLANYKAEKRKVELGYELEDWLDTEQEYLL
jgi:hypothetical protein